MSSPHSFIYLFFWGCSGREGVSVGINLFYLSFHQLFEKREEVREDEVEEYGSSETALALVIVVDDEKMFVIETVDLSKEKK